jgi:hypothetical protein
LALVLFYQWADSNVNTNLIRQGLNEDAKPFVFRLSDRTRVRVVHPDFVAVAPGLVVVIGKNYSITKIDPLHVVAIEEAGRKRSNGKGAN